ncbi:hypothetical protein BH10CYA1_BH10CYA1_13430 [soil metagenome]
MLKSKPIQYEMGQTPPVDSRAFSVRKACRYRWNVLALLSILGGPARTSHIFINVDMSRVQLLRRQLLESNIRVTVTAFLLKAISICQERFPASRTACLPGGRLVTFNNIVAGFTVEREIDGEPAVFFGEIEAPQKKPISEIAAILKDFADGDINKVAKLKQQKLFAEMPWLIRQSVMYLGALFPFVRLKCMAATFGLSSLGALGVVVACGPSVSTSVFGIGAVVDCPVVIDQKVVIKPIVNISLNYDQRVMDARVAARFLQAVKTLLEDEDMNWVLLPAG